MNFSAYSVPGIARTIDEIISDAFGVDVCELRSKSRDRNHVEARHFAMYYRNMYMREPTTQIGQRYNRDHSTVIHARKTVQDLILFDKLFKVKAEAAIRQLNGVGYGAN